ncbi:hypothetical protein [Streptosporangium sp. NPDC006007]|uniref:hypothetical protein n=1 Tax=Streptosporangium sp. NPDC006007 TaxID=3154575 RepID=UPI0033B14946
MPRFLPRILSRLPRAPRPGTAEHRPVKLLHIGAAMALTLVAACALAALLLSGALAWLGLPETTGKQYGLKTLLDIIKISLAVVGGIGGAVALVVAYRKQRLAEEENHRAREENERARQAARREDTKLYAERFDKAGDKLGAESAAVRLAGVHALAALADDWDGGRQMCNAAMFADFRWLSPRPMSWEDELQ